MDGKLSYDACIEAAWVQFVFDEHNTFFSMEDLETNYTRFMELANRTTPPPYIDGGNMNYHLMWAHFGHKNLQRLISHLERSKNDSD